MKHAILAASMALAALMPATGAAQQQISGSWSIASPRDSQTVRLELRTENESGGYHDESSEDVSLHDLHLTQAQLQSPGGHVTFSLEREAGTLSFDGWLQQGQGGGRFTFAPSLQYGGAMRQRGYTIDEPRKVLAAAMLDVSTAFTDEMNGAGIGRLTFDQLITFRALRIDVPYLRQMRSRFGDVDAQQLTSLRALNVDEAYLQEMASVGYAHLEARQAIELRALRVDAEFVRRLQAHGFHNLTVQKLVEAKALGVL